MDDLFINIPEEKQFFLQVKLSIEALEKTLNAPNKYLEPD